MKYKVGDAVVITANTMEHCFEIGERVIITDVCLSDETYSATNYKQEWFICDDDIDNLLE